MTDDDGNAITFRCPEDLERRAKVGAGRRNLNLSEYLRTLVKEDTSDIDDAFFTTEHRADD